MTATIRPYRPSDRDAVRAICIQTGIRGRPVSEMLDHSRLWADLWTEYYLVRERGNCWVACDGGRVVGYLIGTADTWSADRFVATRVAPAAALRAIFRGHWLSPRDRLFFVHAIRAARKGELAIPDEVVRDFPAHFHFNLLAECRGQGLGGRMYEIFERRMRTLGVRGMHGQVIAANEVVVNFHLHRGYREAHHSPVPSLSGVLEPGNVELAVFVKKL
jgi:GNAT superfamily N-acetyltransferase